MNDRKTESSKPLVLEPSQPCMYPPALERQIEAFEHQKQAHEAMREVIERSETWEQATRDMIEYRADEPFKGWDQEPELEQEQERELSR